MHHGMAIKMRLSYQITRSAHKTEGGKNPKRPPDALRQNPRNRTWRRAFADAWPPEYRASYRIL